MDNILASPARHVCVCVCIHTVYIHIGKKVKFTVEQATKAQKGSRGIALLFRQPRR